MSDLKTHLKNKKKKQSDFAKDIGVTQNTINVLVNGKSMPSLRLAYKIERATGGLVTLYDWISEDEKKNEPKQETKKDKKHQ